MFAGVVLPGTILGVLGVETMVPLLIPGTRIDAGVADVDWEALVALGKAYDVEGYRNGAYGVGCGKTKD